MKLRQSFCTQALLSAVVFVVVSSANAYLVPGPGSGGGEQDGVSGTIDTVPGDNGAYGVPPDARPYDPVQMPAPVHGGNYGYPVYYPTQPGYPQYGGVHGSIGQQQGLNARRLVNLLFRGALMRQADSQGLEYFIGYIRNGGYAGLIQAARDIGNSSEMSQLVWQSGPRRVVNSIYRVFFGRTPDPGAEGWVRMFQQGRGGEALAGIVSSQEFAQKQLR